MAQKELKRVLSKLGVASRKNAEKMVKDGRVTVNGRLVRDPLQPVNFKDKILLDGQEITDKKLEIYALNKPQGVVTTMSQAEERPKVADLMPKHQYLFPVGRLDKASRGLLLFTNDNAFADQLLNPGSNISKVYEVQVKGGVQSQHLEQMKNGINIENEKYTVKEVSILRANPKTTWLTITLSEGKNREIRKILMSLGYEVLDLIRIQIGKLQLKELELKPGEYKLVEKRQII